MNQNEAEATALNILSFLMGDDQRRERFMSLSGMNMETLRQDAGNPVFLAGILDYLLQDETLIYMFADAYNITPDLPARARRALSGGKDTGDYY